MDKICRRQLGIKGVDRVSPFCKACPVSPKTPENIRPLMKISGLFFVSTSNKDLKTEATTTHNVVLKTVSVSNPAEIGRVVKTQELP